MEKIKENLPIFSVALLILGTVNLIMYYNYFHIDILSYLDFTEVLQIQFRLFAIAVILVFGQVIYTVTGVHLIQKIKVLNDSNSIAYKYLDKINSWLIKLTGGKSVTKRILSLILMSTILFFILSLQSPKMLYMYLLLDTIVPCLLIMNLFYTAFKNEILEEKSKNEIADFLEERKKAKSNLNLLGYILAFVFLTYISGLSAIISAMDTVLYSSTNEATVTTEKASFSTNTNYRFIGRTKNFIFFYNIPRKQAEIFPNSDIKSIYLRDGIRYEEKIDSLYHFKPTRQGLKEWLAKATMKMR